MRQWHRGYSPAGRSEHVPDAHVLRSATPLPPLPFSQNYKTHYEINQMKHLASALQSGKVS